MFAGVNRANFILEFQDKTDFSGKEQVLAQARFLRAYYYFELVKWFGAVPLAVDTQILFGEESSYERSPVDQVYAQIEQDLRFAAASSPFKLRLEGRQRAACLVGQSLPLSRKIYRSR